MRVDTVLPEDAAPTIAVDHIQYGRIDPVDQLGITFVAHEREVLDVKPGGNDHDLVTQIIC